MYNLPSISILIATAILLGRLLLLNDYYKNLLTVYMVFMVTSKSFMHMDILLSIVISDEQISIFKDIAVQGNRQILKQNCINHTYTSICICYVCVHNTKFYHCYEGK